MIQALSELSANYFTLAEIFALSEMSAMRIGTGELLESIYRKIKESGRMRLPEL